MARSAWAGGIAVLLAACSPDGAAETAGSTSTGTGSAEASPITTSAGDASTTSDAAASSDAVTPTTSDAVVTTSTGTTSGDTSTGDTGTGMGTSTGEPAPLLRAVPASFKIEVKSGWSFPTQFAAVLDDGLDTPVAATWTVDEPALGRVTRYGGTFAARNTAGGTVQVVAEYEGQVAAADVEVVIVDDAPTCPARPPLTDGDPAPGAFVRVVAPEYEGTGVYHGVYLPPDWVPGRRYPVIVESPCNKYQTFSGKVDDTRLGYHLSGCRDYVYIVLPYIQAGANLDYGWGELDANLNYWQLNVQRTLAAVGGDPGAVIVAGFSRGAIGASYIGLQNDDIADAWLGFFMHSHADVVTNLTPDGGAGSSVRMGRVAGRASLLSWGAAGDGGMGNSVKGVELLTSFGYPVETLAAPGVGHTDTWMIDDAVSRAAAQAWLFDAVARRPGTGAVYGRVTDALGDGVAGVRVEAGPLHWDVTDAAGYYAVRGLVHGMRTVSCTDASCSAAQMVDVGDVDVEDVDFALL